MNIYIDVGALNGDTLDCKTLFNFDADYKIAFEPNPRFTDDLINSDADEIQGVAAWVHNGDVLFSVDESDKGNGSTIMPGKKSHWDKGKKINVPCIDFSEYIKKYKHDNLIIKFDCEGAEYPILEKMIKQKTILIPKKIYVEFHPNKVREYTTTYTGDLKRKIKEMGVSLVDWH